MTGSCSTCSPLPGPATPCSCPSHVPPCTWLSPHLVPDLSIGFCLRSKTQTWILTPTTPGGVAGVEVCIWPVAEGRRQLGHDIAASTRCNPGVRRCSARATWQPPRAMSRGGWGTGQSCHPLGLRSWVSSQPFQEQPGPAQPAPSPLHEALTLQMFRDSAYSRNSQRARNSGWRAAASCGICQHRRKVSGGRCSPFYLLYRLPPAATSPRGLPQPLCPPEPVLPRPFSAAGPHQPLPAKLQLPAEALRTAPQPAPGKQDPFPSNLQETSSQPAVPATALPPE